MDIDSKTLARELRMAFSRFSQAVVVGLGDLFSAAALLAPAGVLGLLVSCFVFRSLLQHYRMILVCLPLRDFRRRPFRRSRRCSGSGGRLLRALCWLLFFLFLLRLLLDARQFAQRLDPFFR